MVSAYSFPLMIAGILAAFLFPGCGNRRDQSRPPPPAVTAATPSRNTVNLYGEYVGQVDSPQTVELRSRVDGFVKEIDFQDGTTVKKGTLLFLIDPAPYEVALQQAQAQLQTSEAALLQAQQARDIQVNKANVEKLQATANNSAQVAKDYQVAYTGGGVSREQVDTAVTNSRQDAAALESARNTLTQSEADYKTRVAQAEATVAVNKAAVAAAELNLGYTRIVAPIDGRIGLALVKIGSLVSSSTLLATISQVDPVWVYFSISEGEAFEFHHLHEEKKLGLTSSGKVPVRMILADGSTYPSEGTIDYVSRIVDPGTGTLSLRAEFPNPDGFLRPGNYAKVRILITQKPNALLIPEEAIQEDQSGKYVLTINDKNVVERRPVKTGTQDEGLIEITEGLDGEERVIANGIVRVRPGMEVTTDQSKIVPAPGAASGDKKQTQ